MSEILMLGYAALTIWLLIKVKSIWFKPLVLIVAYLIPTADDMYYRHQLNTYCKTQAGYKVYVHASKKVGIVDNYLYRTDFMMSFPLDTVEVYDDMKKFHRYEKLSDGSIKEINIDHLSLPYELVYKEVNNSNFIETKLQIIERRTGNILGERTNLNYYGGWWRRGLLGSIADSGPTLVADCRVPDDGFLGRNILITQVFTKD